MSLATLCLQLERNLFVLSSVASELNVQIDVNGRRCGSRFGQAGAYGDYGELRASRYLNHVKIAVAVSRIKRFNWYSDQEVALTRVANTFSPRRVSYTLTLMERVRYVICESALLKNPLGVSSSKGGDCRE